MDLLKFAIVLLEVQAREDVGPPVWNVQYMIQFDCMRETPSPLAAKTQDDGSNTCNGYCAAVRPGNDVGTKRSVRPECAAVYSDVNI